MIRSLALAALTLVMSASIAACSGAPADETTGGSEEALGAPAVQVALKSQDHADAKHVQPLARIEQTEQAEAVADGVQGVDPHETVPQEQPHLRNEKATGACTNSAIIVQSICWDLGYSWINFQK